VDLSAFIFVALAVAWAVYLVPKALKHHDEVVRSRSVDRFSHTMRVLARREPVNRRDARLVVTPGRPASSPVVTAKPSAAAGATDAALVPPARTGGATAVAPTRRETARRAAARRRNVLAVLLLATLVVVGVAASGVIGWAWTAIPAAVVVAWLVTCRLMVRRERTVRAPRAVAPRRTAAAAGSAEQAPVPMAVPPAAPMAAPVAAPVAMTEADVVAGLEDTSSMPAVRVPEVDPTLWDPVPVTLPTYVTKPAAARRTVRTIDLDDTGVWTSGRTEGDAAIARDAHAADQVARSRSRAAEAHRAVGS
jgi:hypothetical protein